MTLDDTNLLTACCILLVVSVVYMLFGEHMKLLFFFLLKQMILHRQHKKYRPFVRGTARLYDISPSVIDDILSIKELDEPPYETPV